MPSQELMDRLASSSAFLDFVEYASPVKAKTKRWEVRSKVGALLLGYVRWKAQWRKYAFFPNGNTVFDERCLSDLGSFLGIKTRDHMRIVRASKKAK